MALCPFADILLISHNVGGPMADIRGFAAHSQVGMGSLYTAFNNPAREASTHFWISQQGRLEQYVDTDRQAWAHANGNPFYWSSELEGMSYKDGPDELRGDPFTSAQIDKAGELIAWLHGLASFPVVENTTPGVAGFGISAHRRITQGTKWATACPGKLRLSQFPELVLATLRHLDGGAPPVTHHRRDTVLVRTKPGTNRVDVFAIGTDGKVRHAVSNDGVKVTSANFAEDLGGSAVGLSGDWAGESFILAAHAPDNRLFYNVWNGKKWGGWAAHPFAILLAG